MASEISPDSAADSLIDHLNDLRKNSDLNVEKSRKAALGLAKQLVLVLDDPLNFATDMLFSPCVATTVKLAVDLNLFALVGERAEGSITTAELSEQSRATLLLVSRTLRLLASIGYVQQVGRDEWTATAITRVMAQSPIMAGYRFLWDVVHPATIKLPQYFREVNFTCPTQPTDGIIQYAQQTQYNVFEYMAKVQPDRLKDFNHFMGNNMGARKYWVDWYPVKENIIDGWKENTTLVVDVGGGRGHDLQAFRSKYPGIEGPLILQDLPHVLSGTQQDPSHKIESQAQDFFHPNQETGARVYFMHHILHDWSDEYALKILSHLRGAMTPGYSKLLIHEPILPDTHISTFQAIYDVTMMIFSGGMERDRSQWSELLDRGGFEVVKFWLNEEQPDADGIIEAIVK